MREYKLLYLLESHRFFYHDRGSVNNLGTVIAYHADTQKSPVLFVGDNLNNAVSAFVFPRYIVRNISL